MFLLWLSHEPLAPILQDLYILEPIPYMTIHANQAMCTNITIIINIPGVPGRFLLFLEEVLGLGLGFV